jgi:hypothetical protein
MEIHHIPLGERKIFLACHQVVGGLRHWSISIHGAPNTKHLDSGDTLRWLGWCGILGQDKSIDEKLEQRSLLSLFRWLALIFASLVSLYVGRGRMLLVMLEEEDDDNDDGPRASNTCLCTNKALSWACLMLLQMLETLLEVR